MAYLYLLSLLTLVAYIGYALKVCGLPASLSDTYYILKDKHRPSWLFQLAMVLWYVVYPFRFLLCVRHCHAVQEEVAVLAGNGVVCECLYWIVG